MDFIKPRYIQVFEDIRVRFPAYRIAIIYVHASEEKVRERCADRARLTGRAVPEELIRASLDDPKQSLAYKTIHGDLLIASWPVLA